VSGPGTELDAYLERYIAEWKEQDGQRLIRLLRAPKGRPSHQDSRVVEFGAKLSAAHAPQ